MKIVEVRICVRVYVKKSTHCSNYPFPRAVVEIINRVPIQLIRIEYKLSTRLIQHRERIDILGQICAHRKLIPTKLYCANFRVQ